MGKRVNRELHQKAVDYALFMISSSYFYEQPECCNSRNEKKLYLNYREVPKEVQIKVEEKCIHYMENLKGVMEFLNWEQRDRKVYILPVEKYGVSEIRYETEGYFLRLMGRVGEKASQIEFAHQILKKTA